MNIKSIHIFLLLAVMAVVHFTAIPFGLYQGRIWIDKPLHALGGVLFSMIGLWLFEKHLEGTIKFIKIFSIINFALFGSFLWELLEFGTWRLLPEFAFQFKFYSPTISDGLSDMLLGLLGGIIVSYFLSPLPNPPPQGEGKRRGNAQVVRSWPKNLIFIGWKYLILLLSQYS